LRERRDTANLARSPCMNIGSRDAEYASFLSIAHAKNKKCERRTKLSLIMVIATHRQDLPHVILRRFDKFVPIHCTPTVVNGNKSDRLK
jgi:hypothetical protein